MEVGRKNRKVGATQMNPNSSRSHSVFSITVESSEVMEDGHNHITVGKLNLVDLAGSERQAKTHAEVFISSQISFYVFVSCLRVSCVFCLFGHLKAFFFVIMSSPVSWRSSFLTRCCSIAG